MTEKQLDTGWTDESRAAFLSATKAFLDAIQVHSDAVLRTTPSIPVSDLELLDEDVQRTAIAYSKIQFDLTGEIGPFDIDDWDDFDSDDIDDIDDLDREEQDPPIALVAVDQRTVYAVTDSASILEAGMRAYLEVRPEESEADARKALRLGSALYEVAHASSWEALHDLDGLRPIRGAAWVVAVEDDASVQDEFHVPHDPDDSGLPPLVGDVLFTAGDRWFN